MMLNEQHQTAAKLPGNIPIQPQFVMSSALSAQMHESRISLRRGPLGHAIMVFEPGPDCSAAAG